MSDYMIKRDGHGLNFYIINPTEGSTLKQQIDNCYLQLNKLVKESKIKLSNIIKQTVFVSSRDISTYIEFKELITKSSAGFFSSFIPTSIIPQPPLNGFDIAFEFAILPINDEFEIKTKKIGNTEYLTVSTSKYIEIIAGGLGTTLEKTDIYTQSMTAFQQMYDILNAEHMSFSNISRQWNYIEKIVSCTEENQHYQVFNDVRTAFYNSSHFENGYPAATGIGTETAGIIIDFIAIKSKKELNIIPIKSPVQRDAHQYTKEVLAHSDKVAGVKDTTPKFERAKALVSGSQCIVFVSGTAAIKGEASLETKNATTHTSMTLENILHLVSPENLSRHGINLNSSPISPKYFRVYVKNEGDYQNVKKECDKNYSNIPTIFLKADICRQELLIEIEGVFSN
jgi:enamine deaminase RidA (YjgF/YER057c/UK114 family)